jgi:hypothetical protein
MSTGVPIDRFYDPLSLEQRPERVFKSGIAGRRVDEPGKAKLVNSTKTLHNGRIEDEELPRFYPDCEPNGVVDDLEATWSLPAPKGAGVRLEIA